MRPPEGALDELSNSVIGNLGYSNVNWDLDTKDYEGNLIASQHAVTSIMEHDVATTPGHISLLHDIHQQTVDVLTPWLIKYVQSKGLRFVTISDCIGIPAYR
jgi:peptidoglycan/xylan/chitin deacetylase (PgdA/CDA1 family)